MNAIENVSEIESEHPRYPNVFEFADGAQGCTCCQFYAVANHACRVSEEMPLYDILNEFQKGHSHMAVVVKRKSNGMAEKAPLLQHGDRELKLDRRKSVTKPASPRDHKRTRRKLEP